MIPTPQQIETARRNASLTQKQAADLVGVKLITWQRWEGKTARKTAIPAGLWELFLIKTKA